MKTVSKNAFVGVLWKSFKSPLLCRIFAFYGVTLLVILPILCYNQRFSLIYRRPSMEIAKNIEQDINTERITDAAAYMHSINKAELHNFLNISVKSPMDVVVTVITQSRTKFSRHDSYQPRYLTQTVAQFLKLMLSHKNKGANFPYVLKLQLCNVDEDGESFTEAEELSQYVNMIRRFPVKKNTFQNIHIFEKEKQDYVFCLNQSLMQNQARYALLVEDDAIPSDNFLSVLKHTLDLHMVNTYHHGSFHGARNDIAFVKFFHPEWLLGYLSLEPERLTELFGLSAICGTLVLNCVCISSKRFVVLVMSILYFALLFLIIGRPHVNKFRELFTPYLHSFSPAPSCCTQALLFPRTAAEAVVEYLSHVTCKRGYAKDSALDTFIKTTNFKSYLVQPNSFTHVGMYSTLHTNLIHPSII